MRPKPVAPFPCPAPGFALVLAAGLACGGASEPTPPGAPAPTTPASVAIFAGDGQQAPAGEPVPVAPAVLVRSGDGTPLPGVTVQFSLSTGGGTLTGANPTTDNAGVARVGSWTLGPVGDQRLTAQAGSLPALTFQASVTPGTELVVSTVGAGGGVVTIAAPGHPYNGLSITVPPETFDTPTEFRLRLDRDPPTLVLPAGYERAGPGLEVATSQSRGNRLMVLDIPVSQVPGAHVIMALYDPVRGVLEVMPTVARSATSVRVVTTHLRGELILGSVPANGAPAAVRDAGGGGAHLFSSASKLGSSGFRVGRG
jgi:hypothetical protein